MTLPSPHDKTGDAAAGRDKRGPRPRRARGFQAAARCARGTLAEAAAGRGFAEPQVLTRWAEIVGDRLADLCTPVKVSYARERGLGATLLVHTAGARAPEVEHLAPRIAERVNQFYGYRAVARVKLTQTTPPAGFAEPAAAFAPPPAAPGPAEERRAAHLARGIEHEGLRAALTRMGAHVLARAGRPGPADDAPTEGDPDARTP